MLIYSHNTPEILIASFRTKEQARNSNFCEVMDDNLPDDLSTLKGNDLIIKEGKGTINIDIALAIAFNSIRSPQSAQQFGKILIANGTNVDTRTIKYYVNRIKNGPLGYDTLKYFDDHFKYITGAYTSKSIAFQQGLGNNLPTETSDELYDGLGIESSKPFEYRNESVDTDFINTIKGLFKTCLESPCNYFAHSGSFGFLSNASQTLNTTTSPKDDITNDTKGIGFKNLETFNKMPQIFQKVASKLNQLTSTTANKFVQTFVGGISAVPTSRTENKGLILSPDLTTHENFSKAQSEVLNKVARSLGDCYRLDDYRRRYNPFHYYEEGGPNAEQAAPPGISGMPVGYKVQKNDALNASVPVPGSETFTTENTWYCPGGGRTAEEIAIEGGIFDRRQKPAYTLEQYQAGHAPYVSVAMDTNAFPYGTLLYSDRFKMSDGIYIPFRVVDTGSAFRGKGRTKMDIATSSIQQARSGTNFTGTWRVAGGSGTQVAPTKSGVGQQQDPNGCVGVSNNQIHQPSSSPSVGSDPGAEPGSKSSALPGPGPGGVSVADLAAYIDSFGFRMYHGSDFTGPLSNVRSGVRNSVPPRDIWNNIIPTIQVLEKLSIQTGKKYNINCSYRSPAYNAALGATTSGVAKNSWHMRFFAIDFGGSSNEFKILDGWRHQGVFSGGLHLYPTFVHVDTRGVNSNW